MPWQAREAPEVGIADARIRGTTPGPFPRPRRSSRRRVALVVAADDLAKHIASGSSATGRGLPSLPAIRASLLVACPGTPGWFDGGWSGLRKFSSRAEIARAVDVGVNPQAAGAAAECLS